jgi:hypothetical protein
LYTPNSVSFGSDSGFFLGGVEKKEAGMGMSQKDGKRMKKINLET